MFEVFTSEQQLVPGDPSVSSRFALLQGPCHTLRVCIRLRPHSSPAL